MPNCIGGSATRRSMTATSSPSEPGVRSRHLRAPFLAISPLSTFSPSLSMLVTSAAAGDGTAASLSGSPDITALAPAGTVRVALEVSAPSLGEPTEVSPTRRRTRGGSGEARGIILRRLTAFVHPPVECFTVRTVTRHIGSSANKAVLCTQSIDAT
eukprot:5452017-Prymnesium_polylepis.1